MIKNETHEFKSEVKQLLYLMINSIYSNKEIFLRELISNSSDAIEKLRFFMLSNKNKSINYQHNPKIQISIDKQNKTISITDNGIGMTYKEIINNLGTIAKSGTKEFLKKIKGKEGNKNELIGQFGVGFYSSFIVAKKVSIYTKHISEKDNKGIFWESEGLGLYNVNNIHQEKNGTTIILHLKKEEKEFLEHWKLKSIIKKYSDHISIPVEIENYDDKKKIISWEQINTAKSIWTKNKREITDKEYQEFYKYITQDTEKPLTWSHNIVEGSQEYINLLYIPRKTTWDMWHKDSKSGLKLYVKHIYIMDDVTKFLPNYLRFVKGIIDSNDLPLNISREILQDNKITQNLKKSLTKRILKTLTILSNTKKEEYKIFWNSFGLILKEGLSEDPINKDLISNLIRFTSINSKTKEQKLSLEKYLKNMPIHQEKIYFLISENYISAINSPHLEIFKKKNIDVLILSDRVDEWMMNYLTEYKNKKFQSISKTDETLEKIINSEIEKSENSEDEYIEVVKKFKEILSDRVKTVRITNRLTETPTVVLTDSNEMSSNMAKLFTAAGQSIPKIKYILELNPKHNLIKKIKNMLEIKKDPSEWIEILFNQAVLAEQGSLENPNEFIKKINKLLSI